MTLLWSLAITFATQKHLLENRKSELPLIKPVQIFAYAAKPCFSPRSRPVLTEIGRSRGQWESSSAGKVTVRHACRTSRSAVGLTGGTRARSQIFSTARHHRKVCSG